MTRKPAVTITDSLDDKRAEVTGLTKRVDTVRAALGDAESCETDADFRANLVAAYDEAQALSLVYTPRKLCGRRLDMNTAGCNALFLLHQAAGLPIDAYTTRRGVRIVHDRVPYYATARQVVAWARALRGLPIYDLPTAPLICVDFVALRDVWVGFLMRCEGYDAA